MPFLAGARVRGRRGGALLQVALLQDAVSVPVGSDRSLAGAAMADLLRESIGGGGLKARA